MSVTIKELWNSRSDAYFGDTGPYAEIARDPRRAFPMAVMPLLEKYMGDLRGKRICVPSGGDNIAAFGFHLLGARVTSCDLSEKQIENAKKIAAQNNWDIDFVCCDSMKLDGIKDGEYDLVYTSNGVHVWIDDMPGMYRNFHRVLKPGGYNIFFETHPVIRPFDNTSYEVKIKKPYSDVGPLEGSPTFDWRTQDFVNAVASAGFTICEMQEFNSRREDLNTHNYLHIREVDKGRFNWPGDTYDWRNNPWAALPQCLCICSRK